MKPILYSLILVFVFSCKQADSIATETDFSFKEQQPLNQSNISHFPKNIRGNYISSDSTYLRITDKQFIFKWVAKNNISFEALEKIKDSTRIIGNKIYYLKEKACEFRRLKDSIEITSFTYDTVFSISENQTAKKIKSCIILNTKDSVFWKIKIVAYNKKMLTLKSLATFEDLNRIDSLSKIKIQRIDSTRNIIQISRKEFKNMLRLRKLGYDQDFKKID